MRIGSGGISRVVDSSRWTRPRDEKRLCQTADLFGSFDKCHSGDTASLGAGE